jgi:uncharacterized protein YueI
MAGGIFLVRKNVEDYLQEGIYGKKEIKGEELKLYLGTYRERVILVLTESQVREKTVYPEIAAHIKCYPDSKLLLNGYIEFEALAKYIQVAKDCKIDYKIVTNKEYHSNNGLVLAAQQAIDKEIITVEKSNVKSYEQKSVKKKKGLLSFLTGMRRKKR